MLIAVGEILFDEFPDYRRVGGAPFNVAYHLHGMGHDMRFVTRVGKDENGHELMNTIRGAGMNTQYVQEDAEHPTGRVEVKLSGRGIPEYTIIENVAYDHIDFKPLCESAEVPGLVCFGSLIQRTPQAREALQGYLAQLPESVIRLYDMNIRPGCDREDIVLPSLQYCTALKLNDEELELAGRMIQAKERGADLVRTLMSRGIKYVALTHGAEGSSFYTVDDSLRAPADRLLDDRIADTVGAGDAFTSVFAHGLLAGWSPQKILEKASWFSQQICTIHGALPPDNTLYLELNEKG
jgi:fructokinase